MFHVHLTILCSHSNGLYLCQFKRTGFSTNQRQLVIHGKCTDSPYSTPNTADLKAEEIDLRALAARGLSGTTTRSLAQCDADVSVALSRAHSMFFLLCCFSPNCLVPKGVSGASVGSVVS